MFQKENARTPFFQRQSEETVPMRLSARNQLKGKIIGIEEGAVNAIVTLDIGGGNLISATISMAAVKDLDLEVGKDAYAVMKATSVMIGV